MPEYRYEGPEGSYYRDEDMDKVLRAVAELFPDIPGKELLHRKIITVCNAPDEPEFCVSLVVSNRRSDRELYEVLTALTRLLD